MHRKPLFVLVPILAALVMLGLLMTPVWASQPAPETGAPRFTDLQVIARQSVKPIDQPNIQDYLRNRQRQQLLEAGQVAEANALAKTGADRVLVILVEFAGTDVFTWTAPTSPTNPATGSQWDPLGIAKASEDTGALGDCSNIITQTKVFTYSGPLHNTIGRPLSAADRSGDSIWTPDFSKQWYIDFMFGNGVSFNYTRTDNSLVNESFIGKSVKQYYQDMSGGTYNVSGDVVGWLPLQHSTWYYDADQCPGARSTSARPQRGGLIAGASTPQGMVRDALDAVNAISNTIPGFNWANYDSNGDGLIDRLWIVHSGLGEEDSTTMLNRTSYGEAAAWSHSSAIAPYSVTQNIAASAYIMMPENGGIGVFAHEYGHNLGADDLYSYSGGETSAGFWTIMADDWTGYPIGFEPPAADPWHLDNWGWLNPKVITDPTQVYTVTLGQASEFPGGAGVYRGVKIALPDGQLPMPVSLWQGQNYWWGGKVDLANARLTMAQPVAIPASVTSATLSFDLVYDTEDQWDYFWVQASDDLGASWQTLTNTETVCTHVNGWVGANNGFPDDLCAAGLGGFTNYNISWPAPDAQTFDLKRFAGQSILVRFWYMTDWGTTLTGVFMDNVSITANNNSLFSDDAENGDAQWTYSDPWVRSDGNKSFTHNYYLQWRNTNANGGYDSALGDSRWRYGPANTGLLVWYNNNNYTDNEIPSYLTDFPGFGPKGRMLVIDANPDPYREPGMVAAGYNNEGGNLDHRSLMRDATFTLAPTAGFTFTSSYPYTSTVFTSPFAGRPAVSTFDDALGYYPGAEYVSRGPGYPANLAMKWVTKQWDASTVVPATQFYGVKAPGYVGSGAGQQEFRYNCASTNTQGGRLGCYYFGAGLGIGYDGGAGNPGDINAQYGWRVELVSEAADHKTAVVRISNSAAKQSSSSATVAKPDGSHTLTYRLSLHNGGTLQQTRQFTYTLDPNLTFISSSLNGSPVNNGPINSAVAGATLKWMVTLAPGQSVDFALNTKVSVPTNQNSLTVNTLFAYNDFINPPEVKTLTTQITQYFVYLPMMRR